MKVILDIDNNALEIILKEGIINSENKIYNVWVASELMDALDNAVTLPDNATNGDAIKVIFPNVKVRYCNNSSDFITYTFDGIVGNTVEKAWWNAPYKGGWEDD